MSERPKGLPDERITAEDIQRLAATREERSVIDTNPYGSLLDERDKLQAIIAQQARDIEVLREAAGQHMPRRADCAMCKALEATQP